MERKFSLVHYWLFDQIRIVDDRTEKVLARLAEVESPEAASVLRGRLNERFGEGLGDKRLEDIVGPPALNKGVADLVRCVECREAAAAMEIGKGAAWLFDLYAEHGASVGEPMRAGSPEGGPTAREIFDTLLQVRLIGMPCDKVIDVIKEEDSRVVWRQHRCLQARRKLQDDWDPRFLFDLRNRWIGGFIRTLNPSARHSVSFFSPDDEPATEEVLEIGVA